MSFLPFNHVKCWYLHHYTERDFCIFHTRCVKQTQSKLSYQTVRLIAVWNSAINSSFMISEWISTKTCPVIFFLIVPQQCDWLSFCQCRYLRAVPNHIAYQITNNYTICDDKETLNSESKLDTYTASHMLFSFRFRIAICLGEKLQCKKIKLTLCVCWR